MNREPQSSRRFLVAISALLLIAPLLFWLHSQHERSATFDGAKTSEATSSSTSQPTNLLGESSLTETNSDLLEALDTNGWRTLRLFVQNKAGLPVGRVTVNVDFEQLVNRLSRLRTYSVETDEAGWAVIRYPTNFSSWVTLHVSAPAIGLGGKAVRWGEFESIPESYTITLGRTTSVGGFVVDESDSPIAGAKVSAGLCFSDGREQYYWAVPWSEFADFQPQDVMSDVEGRWQLRDLPLALLDMICIGASHPEYVSRNYWKNKDEFARSLQAGDFRIVLRHGDILRVLVLNQSGDPLPEAEVGVSGAFSNEDYGWSKRTTDNTGKASFGDLSKGLLWLRLKAKGHQTATNSVTIPFEGEELVQQLKPGQFIHGAVKNEAGEPLPAVSVRSVGNQEFSAFTDAVGRFEWDSAPDSLPQFAFRLKGHLPLLAVALQPGAENLITMKRPPQIHGWVLNAATDEPVKQFRIATGQSAKQDPFRWSLGQSFSDPHGRFTFEEYAEGNDLIRAEADGYERQELNLHAFEGNEPLVFHLKAQPVLRGLVVSSTGTPLAGIRVLPARPRASVTLERGCVVGESREAATTDAQGQFALPNPPSSDGQLIAAGHQGFCQIGVSQVEAGNPIVLKPYGTVCGRLFVDQQPAPRRWVQFKTKVRGVAMSERDFANCQRTDEEGDFAFTLLPPGDGMVLYAEEGSSADEDAFPVTVRAGGTTRMEIRW